MTRQMEQLKVDQEGQNRKFEGISARLKVDKDKAIEELNKRHQNEIEQRFVIASFFKSIIKSF